MPDLVAISQAIALAIADADAHGAATAARVLRHEVCTLQGIAQRRCLSCEFHPTEDAQPGNGG